MNERDKKRKGGLTKKEEEEGKRMEMSMRRAGLKRRGKARDVNKLGASQSLSFLNGIKR